MPDNFLKIHTYYYSRKDTEIYMYTATPKIKSLLYSRSQYYHVQVRIAVEFDIQIEVLTPPPSLQVHPGVVLFYYVLVAVFSKKKNTHCKI